MGRNRNPSGSVANCSLLGRLAGCHSAAGAEAVGDVVRVGPFDDGVTTQSPLSLARFLTQNVTTVGGAMLDLAGSGHFEPLLHSLMCLLLGHQSLLGRCIVTAGDQWSVSGRMSSREV